MPKRTSRSRISRGLPPCKICIFGLGGANPSPLRQHAAAAAALRARGFVQHRLKLPRCRSLLRSLWRRRADLARKLYTLGANAALSKVSFVIGGVLGFPDGRQFPYRQALIQRRRDMDISIEGLLLDMSGRLDVRGDTSPRHWVQQWYMEDQTTIGAQIGRWKESGAFPGKVNLPLR